MVLPVGSFTPNLSRRVRDTALASAQKRDVIISMQSTQNYSWSALHDLAESLRAAVTPHRIRLANALPSVRSLLREVGIESGWFVDAGGVKPGALIVLCEAAPAALSA